MGKYRIFEVAKDFSTTSKVIIDILNRNNIPVKNHMSSIDEPVREVIAKTFAHKADKPVVKRPEPIPAANPAPQQAPVKASVPVQKNVPAGTQPHRAQGVPPRQYQGTSANQQNRPAQQQNRFTNQNRSNEQRPRQGQGPSQGQGGLRQGQGQSQGAGQGQVRQAQAARPAGTSATTGTSNRPYTPNQNNRPGAAPRPGFDRPRQGGQGGTGSSQQSHRPAAGGGQRSGGPGGAKPRTDNTQRPGGFTRPAGSGQQSRPTTGQRPNTGTSAPRTTSGTTEKRFTNNKPKAENKPKGSYATKKSRPHYNTRFVGKGINKSSGNRDQQPARQQAEPVRPTHVEIGDSINVKAFAELIKREVSEVIKHLFLLGVMVTINQDIDFDTAVLIGTEFNVEVAPLAPEDDPTEIPEVEDDPALRITRPPVVTVMGHVDHGKTSLLDAIRKTHVTAREAGGITQHIGAYQVNSQGKKIVFLDTPGHEAFTAMRARGAQVTDIAILVVAADDGVMPQTIEAINHAKAAKVPIIVAINKMDREGANPDHVKQQLAELEVIPEDWGGDTIMVPVSAHKQTGIPELLEMILMVAEVQDLKANPDLPAHGTIIEAQLDKGRGPVATVLIGKGTLRVGDTIIAGTAYGKVRAMINDRGEKVKKAGPSTPVEVLGLSDVPLAGDILDATEEKVARAIAEKRIAKKRTEEIQQQGKVSLDDIFQRIQEGELKELNIVVKADVQGTIEALKQSLSNIKNEEVKVVIVHAGVGTINESDIMLASAANALIIGFNVRPDSNARKAADAEKVDIRTYRVIYDALNDVEAAIKGMLAPKFKENIIGKIEVRQIITISKMMIAGCYVLEGKVTSNAKIRLIRDGIVIHEGELESLRRFKDDVKEVAAGYECGITLEKFKDVKEGDILEAFVMEEIKQ